MHKLKIVIAALGLVLVIGGIFAFFDSRSAYAAISFVGGSGRSTSTDGDATITLSRATGIVAGDMMFAQVVITAPSRTITAPSGWTLIRRDSTGGTLSSALYYKIATGSEPSSYTWSFNDSEAASASMVAYRGMNPSTPIDVTSARLSPDSDCPIVGNSVTTTQSNGMLLFIGSANDNITLSAPSGMTTRYNVESTNTTSFMADQLLGGVGSTGSRSASCSGSSGFSTIGTMIVLRNAAAPTPTPTPAFTPTPTPITYSITGSVYIDTNGNGVRDTGEAGYTGATITRSGVSSGSTTTAAGGSYSFSNLAGGNYTVTITVPAGFSSAAPSQTRTLGPNTTVNFGLSQFYSITGRVFRDGNKNGVQDAGEQNYSGRPTITASRGTVTTNLDGSYVISNLAAGSVIVSYGSLPPDYALTYPLNGPPPSFQVTVGPGCGTNGARGASCQ